MITNPPQVKPQVRGGTFTYELNATPIVDHRFSVSAKPGMVGGTVEYGPPAGLQYRIDNYNLDFIISDNQETIVGTVTTPYIETIHRPGPPDPAQPAQLHTQRHLLPVQGDPIRRRPLWEGQPDPKKSRRPVLAREAAAEVGTQRLA